MLRVWHLLAVLALIGGCSRGWGAPMELRDGDRIVLLGDTFFEREGEYGCIEAAVTAAFSDRRLQFRNLAWAADTPSGRARASFDWNKTKDDWRRRVAEQVELVRPTVAFLSYGMTAALEGGRKGLPGFEAELGELMDAVAKAAGGDVRFVLIGPVAVAVADGERGEALSEVLRECEAAVGRVARARGALFVGLMDVDLRLGSGLGGRREGGGLIPNEGGYGSLAGEIVRALGGSDTGAGAPAEARALLRAAVVEKNAQFFHRWRPANWTYLFGFRKHEQGRNAVEIPRFDPIVEEWDRRISGLRDLGRQDPAVVSEVRTILDVRRARWSGAGGAVPTAQVGGVARAGGGQAAPTFAVDEGLEVTLWAENPHLFKPIQINWDPKGRLWVASSRVYPQIRPGQEAEDAIVVLEDVDGDGVAEKSTVFADGLLIPTAVVPDGMGGCYVGASHQLLHFSDTDGDGRADRRRVVLSSFGTEDTHHNLHTLRWGYDGHLYMSQSIYTHTHVETPFGVRRLNSAGIWRFRPETYRLEVFTRGGCNPWGHHWDQYGNHFFTDGAGNKGIYHALEGATYFTYSDMRREADSISPGNYPKFCSLEVIRSPAFPKDWQGQLVTCDFRAHRVVRFGLKEAGSTFQTVEMPDLARSTNVTFRPIDLRLGPDGALYVADWSNPIIQHGEVDFRDARRDKEHGRIWRVAAKGAAAGVGRRDLTACSTDELLKRTLSGNGWEQEQARLVLRNREAGGVLERAGAWASGERDPRAQLEWLWLQEAFGRKESSPLEGLVASEDPRLRAAAARQLGQ